MDTQPGTPSASRLIRIGILAWLSILGVDFFLHAGLLSNLYARSSPFLLPPEEAFRRIPLGYLALILLTVLMIWLMVRLGVTGWRAGFAFGLKLGLLMGGIMMLGMASISTADADMLIAWALGQSVELAIAGAVAGRGFELESLGALTLGVMGLVIALAIITVVLQSIGFATAMGI